MDKVKIGVLGAGRGARAAAVADGAAERDGSKLVVGEGQGKRRSVAGVGDGARDGQGAGGVVLQV